MGSLEFPALVAGPDSGETVLCVHGFPDTRHSFAALLGRIGAKGYRAVAPAIRGYARSAVPADRSYHVCSLVDDVVGWLDALGVGRAHLVGHDWGAVMAYAAAALAPHRVATLTAVAIPPPQRLLEKLLGRPSMALPLWYMALLQAPELARHAIGSDQGRFVGWLWRRWSPGLDAPLHLERARRMFADPVITQAALAYYRQLFSLWSPLSRRSIALLRRPVPVPTTVVHGDRDGCMPTGLYAPSPAERRLYPAGIRRHRLSGVGHFVQLEAAEALADIVLATIDRHTA